MADNDQLNDEYQFTEVDPLNPILEDTEESPTESTSRPSEAHYVGGNNVKRNAMIAVVLFVGLMLGYKFIGAYFTQTKSMVTPMATPEPVVAQPEPPPAIPESPPIASAKPAPAPVTSAPVIQPTAPMEAKLSDLELGQENLASEVAEFNGQIGTISSNLETLSAKVTELNRIITALNDKLESQSHEIERLRVKPVVQVAKPARRSARRSYRYYIQAVIPGRAWLVAANGSTLTVREGSAIPGYGEVKLIDPNQGRVITSSGQVIRFSQEDS